MIDYIKLKKAHELAHKYSEQSDTLVGIEIFFQPRREFHCRVSMQAGDSMTSTPIGIDDLITKLKELTAPEPKYRVGDKVWIINYGNEPEELTIQNIDLNSDEKYLTLENWHHENELYPSREALIDAQIAYWKGLK